MHETKEKSDQTSKRALKTHESALDIAAEARQTVKTDKGKEISPAAAFPYVCQRLSVQVAPSNGPCVCVRVRTRGERVCVWRRRLPHGYVATGRPGLRRTELIYIVHIGSKERILINPVP